VFGEITQQPLARLVQQLSNGLPFERSVSDYTGMFVAVAQDPSFADRAIARERRRHKVAQTSTTPKPILVDRFESQRIERYIIHQKYYGVIARFGLTPFRR
jgi:hypothetical protein